MSKIFGVHVVLDKSDEVFASLDGDRKRPIPLLKVGDATISFPYGDDPAIVEVCDRIVSAALEIRAEALARMVAAA